MKEVWFYNVKLYVEDILVGVVTGVEASTPIDLDEVMETVSEYIWNEAYQESETLVDMDFMFPEEIMKAPEENEIIVTCYYDDAEAQEFKVAAIIIPED